ncbi:MAG: hypothetical protein R3C12_05315 [Planctomycetaceae bacterium]
MINDRTIYAQGGAWDLLTGYELPFEFKRSYGCGVLAGSKHTMVFRSATLRYFDFERQGRSKTLAVCVPDAGSMPFPREDWCWFRMRRRGVFAAI